ncbi:MAG: hypothetical protein NDJ89_07625 [Oligoflexia bacterium]|nr:hypothetical protein [Oligoflexia bacterium]
MVLTALVALAASILAAAPFAAAAGETPSWRDFRVEGSHVTVAIEERVEATGAGEAGKLEGCARWKRALPRAATRERGAAIQARPGHSAWSAIAAGWQSWNASERDQISGCRKHPCRVKLEPDEVARLAQAPSAGRLKLYEKIIDERVAGFLEGGAPAGSPWDALKAAIMGTLGPRGAIAQSPEQASRELWSRKIDFAPGKMKTVRQLLELRDTSAPEAASSWLRAIYSDHYFDSWAEWAQVRCDGGQIVLAAVLVTDLDLLKKNDLFTKLGRPKIRAAAEERGFAHLERVLADIRRRATQGP